MPKAITRFSETNPLLVTAITWVVRIFVGGLFIFSGFTKGIDVWGTIFKFREYFSAWGYEVWEALNLVGVFLLCLLEFLTGFFLVFGCFRRAAPVVAVLIMAFMLPLTLWLAIVNPIADCGCFGDALKLSNWQTFYKNVVITIGAIWLLIYNRSARCLISPYIQWIALVVSGVYFFIVAWLGYYYQPLIDFRPYKIGTALVEAEENDNESDEDSLLRFVYEKDGEKKEFTIDDDLPDEADGWTFIERYYADSSSQDDVTIQQPDLTPHVKNIRFYTEDGREDVTYDVVGHGHQLILMIPELSDVTAATTWKINSLYDWCQKNDIEMLAAVGGNPYEISKWKDISLAQYPIYTSDDTSIEEVVRGNPGLVFLDDGIIKWKSTLNSINIDDFQGENISADPMYFARDNNKILFTLTWIYITGIAIMIFLSIFPQFIYNLIKSRYHKKSNVEETKEKNAR